MAVAWPAVRAALASSLTTALPAFTVYNGPVVTGEAPSYYLTVAHQPSTTDESAGSFEPDTPQDGFTATETGTILCELGGVTGDTTVPSVFDAFDVITSLLQADQTLGGVLYAGSTITASADVLQAQNQAGAVQRLLVTISYFTRLP
jgi:hypothetical protein